jgi:hypothetical protein
MPEMSHVHGGSDDWNPAGSNPVRDFSASTSTNNQNSNYNAHKHAAETYKAAGAVTSGALSGTALWEQEGLPKGVYHSTFQKGQQAYSPTGYIYIDPEGDGTPQALGRDKHGNIVWDPSAYTWDPHNQKWFRSNYKPWSPTPPPQRGSGGSNNYGYGYGYGGGRHPGTTGGGVFAASAAQRYWGPGKARGSTGAPLADMLAYRQQNPVQPKNIRMYTQSLVNANRGGIMSLRR